MRPRQLAAAALLMLLTSTPGWACDSYDDDMSLASVLAQAVAQARADGTLQPPANHAASDAASHAASHGASHGASRAGAPEPPLPAVEGGGAALAPKS